MQANEDLTVVVGELSNMEHLQSALRDVDATICCLGTHQHKPADLMQKNLPLIVQAMKRAGRTRLILLSAYAVGATALTASPLAKILYTTMFRRIFYDKECPEADLAISGLDWTGIYPVGLTDGPLIQTVPDSRAVPSITMRIYMRIPLAHSVLLKEDGPMPRPATSHPIRRPTNVTLPVDLVTEARALGLNVSQACEQGLKVEIARSRAAQWLEENKEAIASSNDYVERHGLPLSEFRQF